MTELPDGFHSITPRIVAAGATDLVHFLQQAFGAEGELSGDAPAILRIGDSTLMVSEAGERAPATAFLYLYVADADACYGRAVELGATPLEAPADMPYGDRRAMVEDAWGNVWQIATYRAAAD